MANKIVYLSFDIEADGPSPCANNMLSLGVCGLTVDNDIVFKYCENIKPLENHKMDPATKADFWDKNPELWANVNENQISCIEAMEKLATGINNLKEQSYVIKWVAMPAAYDWQWLNYYWNYAVNSGANLHNHKLGFKAECISTAWSSYILMTNTNKTDENTLWNTCYGENPCKHNAYYDALHQGYVYIALLKLFSGS